MKEASQKDSSCRIEKVRLWLKVFIPEEVEGAERVPAGPHQGKTMLHSPNPVALWFLTDGRGFDSSPEAPSRMHSEIELDLLGFEVIREFHQCGSTIQVNHETGEEECHETANTDEMRFEDIKLLPDMRIISMKLKGSTKNACLKLATVKLSPNVDYEGEISLRLHENLSELTVKFHGEIETYPAFEMYLMINDGAAVPVFQLPVAPEANPLSLIGPPTRAVNVSIIARCSSTS